MSNTNPQSPQNQDTFTHALADVLLMLRRKREAREARQTAGAEDKRGAHE